MGEIPRQALPPLSGRLVDKMHLVWVVSAKLSSVFIMEERDLGSALHLSLQILASAPRFLINVILIGFRSLEKTK